MIFMPSVCKVDKNHFQLRKVNQNISFVRSIINTLKYFALIHSSNGKWALILREIDPKRRRKQHQLKFVINWFWQKENESSSGKSEWDPQREFLFSFWNTKGRTLRKGMGRLGHSSRGYPQTRWNPTETLVAMGNQHWEKGFSGSKMVYYYISTENTEGRIRQLMPVLPLPWVRAVALGNMVYLSTSQNHYV